MRHRLARAGADVALTVLGTGMVWLLTGRPVLMLAWGDRLFIRAVRPLPERAMVALQAYLQWLLADVPLPPELDALAARRLTVTLNVLAITVVAVSTLAAARHWLGF